MTDESRIEQNPVGQQGAAMPTANQQPVAGAETKVQAPQLPNEASEHARQQFERLQEQLRTEREQLRAEKEKRLYYESVFSAIQQQQQIPQKEVPKDTPPPIYDPNTGLINEKAFESQQKAIEEAKKQAEQAEARAKSAEETARGWMKNEAAKSQESEEKEAIAAYPELNYKEEKVFNKKFHAQVRAVLTDSMLHPEDYGLDKNAVGKGITYKQAADAVKGASPQVVEQARQEGATEAMQKVEPKEQASLEATNNASRRSESTLDNFEELQRETRRGNLDAIVARMRGIYGQPKG